MGANYNRSNAPNNPPYPYYSWISSHHHHESSVILFTSFLASSHVSWFFFAHSIWLFAYASYLCQLSVSKFPLHISNRERPKDRCKLTIYRFKSSSFSDWKRFRSFRTPELASRTSCCETVCACSSCEIDSLVFPI